MYMVFQFSGQPYAVPIASLRELFKLPKLTAVEHAIACLSGTVNCRGKIIPVLDFAAVMGHPRACYQLEDVVMVLEHAGHTLGLIVSDVSDIEPVAEESIVPLPANLLQQNQTNVIRGQANGRNQALLTILDIASLFSCSAAHLPDPALTPHEDIEQSQADAHFLLQQFDTEARATLSERARKIAASTQLTELEGTDALAIIQLSGEFFGIRLNSIREFAVLHRFIPLPACPAHIAGSMNLRGEVLILLDLRSALHLDAQLKQGKVVVMNTPELGLFGVLVDGIQQVVHLLVQDVSRLPAGLDKFDDSYLNGLVDWGDSKIPVLDIPTMLSSRCLS